MIIGGYVLHVYCDGTSCNSVETRARGIFPSRGEFSGDTGGQARRAARKNGWKLDDASNKAYCRKCSGERG